MLEEAVEVIRERWTGGVVEHHFVELYAEKILPELR